MRIREKAKRYGWCKDSLKQLQDELDEVIAAKLDIPAEPGGWWHQYVCPEHHTELLFDPLLNEPGSYRCPYGCELSGKPYYGAWLVFKHQALARYALQAAAVYAGSGIPAYGELGRTIIVSYAEQFPHYPVHPDAQPWMLKGRAFHQALTEAIWSTTLLRAYKLLLDEGISFDGYEETIHAFLKMLEQSMEEYHHILTHERGTPENNYTAWLNAALVSIHSIHNDSGKLEQLMNGEGGVKHHLSVAVHADQLEFEGSVYYHIFVLRAYMIAAEMAERHEIDCFSIRGEQGQSIEGMLDVLVLLADENGVLPALHDGPYERVPYTREVIEVFEIGWARFQKPGYLSILSAAYRTLHGGQGRIGSLEAVLYGAGSWRCEHGSADGQIALPPASNRTASLLLPDSGFAILNHADNSLSCLLDYGPHGGAHGHYDKLNLILRHRNYPLSPDRGTVPYGSELKKNWYPATACHNTVTIGGKSQLPSGGECLSFEATARSTYIWARANQAYEEAILDRHVLVTERWVLDWYQVQAAQPEQIDWWFHYCGELMDDDAHHWEACPASLGDSDGYEYIQARRTLRLNEIKSDTNAAQVDFKLAGEDGAGQEEVMVSLLLPNGAAVTEVSSPGLASDPSVRMNGLLHRSYGHTADIIALYRTGGEPVRLVLEADSPASQLGQGNRRLKLIIGEETVIYEWTDKGLKELTA